MHQRGPAGIAEDTGDLPAPSPHDAPGIVGPVSRQSVGQVTALAVADPDRVTPLEVVTVSAPSGANV